MEDGSVEDNKTEATPGMLRTFRKSRVWKAATAGINYDVHEVRAGGLQRSTAAGSGCGRGGSCCCALKPPVSPTACRRLRPVLFHLALRVPASECPRPPHLQVIKTDATIHEIHNNAEVFDHSESRRGVRVCVLGGGQCCVIHSAEQPLSGCVGTGRGHTGRWLPLAAAAAPQLHGWHLGAPCSCAACMPVPALASMQLTCPCCPSLAEAETSFKYLQVFTACCNGESACVRPPPSPPRPSLHQTCDHHPDFIPCIAHTSGAPAIGALLCPTRMPAMLGCVLLLSNPAQFLASLRPRLSPPPASSVCPRLQRRGQRHRSLCRHLLGEQCLGQPGGIPCSALPVLHELLTASTYGQCWCLLRPLTHRLGGPHLATTPALAPLHAPPALALPQIWVNSAVSKNSSVPTWILAIGGFGIVFGKPPCHPQRGRACPATLGGIETTGIWAAHGSMQVHGL